MEKLLFFLLFIPALLAGQTVLLGDEQYGSELVINGDFAVSTGWTFNDDWSYDAVNLEADYTDGIQSYFDRSITITAGITYQVSYTIKNYSAGTGYIWFTNQTGSGLFSVTWWTITANGVFTANYAALESATSLKVYAHSLSVNYSVDDISIKAVTKEAGFVLTDGTNVLTQDYPGQINDGNTVAWYIADELSTITKDGSDLVALWADYLGSGRDLVQGTGADKPMWSENGVLFGGGSDFMKTAAFTLVQPEMIYIVFKNVTWILNTWVLDGNATFSGALYQTPNTPDIRAYAGSVSDINSNLPVNTFGIVRILFNGVSSTIQVDETTQTTRNFGAADMGGFTLGARGDGLASFANIQIKEVILRNVDDTDATEEAIFRYLKRKYGLSPNGLIFMFMLMLYIGNRKRFNEKKLYI